MSEATLTIDAIAGLLARFSGDTLTRTLSGIEQGLRGMTLQESTMLLQSNGVAPDVLAAAAELKRLAGQVHVTIHALGILLCLPHILEVDERIEYASLDAGNSGRPFDLETDRRIAEFKFINWRGNDAVRLNTLFKDYMILAEAETTKTKHLYLLGTDRVLRFLQGRSAIERVLGSYPRLKAAFLSKYGGHYAAVGDYYQAHKGEIAIEDVSSWLHALKRNLE